MSRAARAVTVVSRALSLGLWTAAPARAAPSAASWSCTGP